MPLELDQRERLLWGTLMPVRQRTTIFPTTRLTLIDRLRDPTARAWDDFFRIYSPIVFRMGRKGQLDASMAEELVQVVMSNFAGSVSSGFAFDPSRGQFRRYLRKITNNSIRMMRDRLAAHIERTDADAERFGVADTSDDDWNRMERQERLRLCVERLRTSRSVQPRDWAAFEAWAIEGQGAATVAKKFGMTPAALYRLKHRLLAKLRGIRERLDQELGEV